MGDARKTIRNRNRRRKQTWASRQRNVASSSAQLMVWLWAVLCNSELCEKSQPRSCCSSENDGHILYGCLSPHFQAKPFKNTSLTVVVYCQGVKGPALFLLIPLLPSCVNVKCVQSMLSALLGPHWSAVFELACTMHIFFFKHQHGPPAFQSVLTSTQEPQLLSTATETAGAEKMGPKDRWMIQALSS